MIPRPRIRLALWAALLLVAAAFVTRSVVMRGGDFSLDLPGDAIALTALVVAGALVAWARHQQANEGEGTEDEPPDVKR